MSDNYKIVQGDALSVLKVIPDEQIDMCMTSPPYWALRDYGTEGFIWDGKADCEHDWTKHVKKPCGGKGSKSANVGANQNDFPNMRDHDVISHTCNKCGAWKGSLGLEPTPELYIKHLCDIFDEVKRVLKPEGSCWVNLGDTYSQQRWSGNGQGQPMNKFKDGHRDINPERKSGLPPKSMVQIPQRFSMEMMNRGWILRNVIIWHKPSCMPSSVRDRFTIDYEWLFFFVKNPDYYFKQQFEPLASATIERKKYKYNGGTKSPDNVFINCPKDTNGTFDERFAPAAGRTKRAVWRIATRPFKEAHFATYPPELCESPIDAGCPVGGTVLDPFSGAATTGLVALRQGKRYIGIELNAEYIKIAEARLK